MIRPIPSVKGNNASLLFAVIEMKCYFVSIDYVELLGLCVFCSFLFPGNSYLLQADDND